jgi:two-component system chemotaxis sensor kinase CheA
MVHTLKGTSAIFGIHTLADACHALETWMDEERTLPTVEQREDLLRKLERVRANLDKLLGADERNRIEVARPEFDAALRAVLHDEPKADLVRRIASWPLEPTSRRLERIAEQANRIADRLNKGPLNVVIEDNGLRLEPTRWASFWSSFLHVIRNAVDHGLESPEERIAAGKSEQGTIELTTEIEGDAFRIEVRDDGRGIDWGAIAEKARAVAIPHESSEDLVEAMFTEGISTARFVTDVSGRGVGMGAVRAECIRRGGTIDLVTRPGAGTHIVFRFPITTMSDHERAQRAA